MGPKLQPENGRVPQILFVGGTKHGDVYQPPALPPVLIVDGPQPERTAGPDPVHVDLATGEQYVLAQVAIGIPHAPPPIPPVPYAAQFYMFSQIPDQQTGMTLVGDALLRRHYLDHGHRLGGPHGPGNGHVDVAPTVYWAECTAVEYVGMPPEPERCRSPIAFATAAERATWMRNHIDTTGHAPAWSNVTPTAVSDSTEGATDGGQRLGDIPQG